MGKPAPHNRITSFNLPRDLLDSLALIAAANDCSVSVIARRYLHEGVDREIEPVIRVGRAQFPLHA